MQQKIYDSERKVLELLWAQGALSAKEIALRLAEQVGWGKTTTYTVIKKCVDKGLVLRREPGFVCTAALTMEQARQQETTELIDKLYGGSADLLMASILESKPLSQGEIARLKALVDRLK